MKKHLLALCCFTTLFLTCLMFSCSEDDNVQLDETAQEEANNATDDDSNEDASTTDRDAGVGEAFTRGAMLTNWADNIIIPAFEALVDNMDSLSLAANTFTENPNQENLMNLKQSWLNAYLTWQTVAMFDIGKAEEITLRNFINVYPLDAQGMTTTLLAGDYDLTSVNRQDEQGFSALDYLLHGLGNSDEEIIAFYTDDTNGLKYKTFLTDIVDRMHSLTSIVLADWKESYRDEFIERDGNAATESVNSMINDYIYYYEKFLRAGKVGIPAGVFSNTPLSDRVEAKYRGNVSKELLIKALHSAQDFFNGVHFSQEDSGMSLNGWINDLEASGETNNIDSLINNQFGLIHSQLENLNSDLGQQVEADNIKMLETYDILQKNVIFMKVDMLQLLDITVDYVDADGD
jgi:hypothetical protein|tara:strand:- start:193 stop:1404 length:1212 start_codon:yes stop_codon:yes gene_type:complete